MTLHQSQASFSLGQEVPDAVTLVEVDGTGLADPRSPFVESLRKPAPAGCFNPWADSNQDDYVYGAAFLRRWLLAQHLNVRPRLILVGEAPGYRGARMCGVPFTSERLIREGTIPRVSEAFKRVFGAHPISTRIGGWSEPSASIVWPALRQCGAADSTVLWNACPWHPMRGLNPLTNRAPTTADLDAGMGVLSDLLDLYPLAHVIAVGGLAEFQLQRLGLGPRYLGRVRHPAYGGATEFREGIARAIKTMETA